ncbi:VWA domain-containing protein [Aestuariivirga sp.]|uniref:VWA domain-containing protein n=1 Tax=Aestuariivirga sp. TaxID=2650926 RepID=UPI0039E23FBA
MPKRLSFRSLRTRHGGAPDLRRSLRATVAADGDVPRPSFAKRQPLLRPVLILIDISGSMKAHTADYLKAAHTAVQTLERVEAFTLGTRLTRITTALKPARLDQALARVAEAVDDWDGGTRIGPTLLALLAVPRFLTFARGAVTLLLSDGLETGPPDDFVKAMRRLSALSHRLSLLTPLAADPRFAPRTEALQAVLPHLDDLADGSSLARLTDFITGLKHNAPAAHHIWNRMAS